MPRGCKAVRVRNSSLPHAHFRTNEHTYTHAHTPTGVAIRRHLRDSRSMSPRRDTGPDRTGPTDRPTDRPEPSDRPTDRPTPRCVSDSLRVRLPQSPAVQRFDFVQRRELVTAYRQAAPNIPPHRTARQNVCAVRSHKESSDAHTPIRSSCRIRVQQPSASQPSAHWHHRHHHARCEPVAHVCLLPFG